MAIPPRVGHGEAYEPPLHSLFWGGSFFYTSNHPFSPTVNHDFLHSFFPNNIHPLTQESSRHHRATSERGISRIPHSPFYSYHRYATAESPLPSPQRKYQAKYPHPTLNTLLCSKEKAYAGNPGKKISPGNKNFCLFTRKISPSRHI